MRQLFLAFAEQAFDFELGVELLFAVVFELFQISNLQRFWGALA